MASATRLTNLYHRRLVAESSSKPCFICFKPSTTVLITPDKRDFFYICAGHLSDRGFATALDADGRELKPEAEAEKQKKTDLEDEIERVKKEWAAKQKGKDQSKTKDKKADSEKAHSKTDAEKEDSVKNKDGSSVSATALASSDLPESNEKAADEAPRVYRLNKDIYQLRIGKLQAAVNAKRTQDRLKNPNTFPTVPTGTPGG